MVIVGSTDAVKFMAKDGFIFVWPRVILTMRQKCPMMSLLHFL